GDSGPEVVPVRGTITYGGGSWPKTGAIYFTPSEAAEGMPLRPALGSFDTDGNVQVTSFQGRSGLVPGTYLISLECWEVPPSMESDAHAVSYLPANYQRAATSGLSVVVEPGASFVEVKFDVPKR